MLMNHADGFSQTFEQLLVFCRVGWFEQFKRKPVAPTDPVDDFLGRLDPRPPSR
jgi:hypothetical protein